VPANEPSESERRGDAALSSQQSRRSARAPGDGQADLTWIGAFIAAAVVGAFLAWLLLHGHASISFPWILLIALIVAVVPGVMLWRGSFDDPPPAGRHGGGPAPRPADSSRFSSGLPPARPPAGANPRGTGGQAALTPDQLASGIRASGSQPSVPGGRDTSGAGWWSETASIGAAATVPPVDPGMTGTVTMFDPAGKDQPGSARTGPAPQAEAVIAQCPQCGSFRMDGNVRSGRWQFLCHECRHEWNWQPGSPWPEVRVRPEQGRRGQGRQSSRRRPS
jgi:hypothetical protein